MSEIGLTQTGKWSKAGGNLINTAPSATPTTKALQVPSNCGTTPFQFIQASRFPSMPITLDSKPLLQYGSSNKSKLHSGMDLRLTLGDGCSQSHVRSRSWKAS